jgi:nicotinamide riboside kinase
MANQAAPRLIALIGTESTGKTTLCSELARHFGGLWVPECVREFYTLHGRPPHVEEQAMVLQQQLAREQLAVAAAAHYALGYVFCDTTPLMTAIYSELVFNDRSLIASAALHQKHYALTLFTQPDIGWQHDGVRDGAHVQPRVTEMIASVLHEYGIRHARIEGAGSVRLAAAVQAIGQLSSSAAKSKRLRFSASSSV